MVNGIRDISTALDHPIDKNDNSAFSSLKSIFEKSLAVNKDLPQGYVLSFEDLEAKKPKNHGIAASDFKNVIGKTLKRDMEAWGFLGEGDVYD
ncbi:SAF domain-containing protein [Flavobacterium sp. CS20]|uniref:SAF domain-containing protein n=1 Tax=Flavobacterium sp. CS20 TaxID=2775246 RepID=UPI0035302D91